MFKQVAIALSAAAFCRQPIRQRNVTRRKMVPTRTCIADELRTSDQVINDVYKTAMASRNATSKRPYSGLSSEPGSRTAMSSAAWIRPSPIGKSGSGHSRSYPRLCARR